MAELLDKCVPLWWFVSCVLFNLSLYLLVLAVLLRRNQRQQDMIDEYVRANTRLRLGCPSIDVGDE